MVSAPRGARGPFSRPEVIEVLKEYYDSLEQKVEVKLHGHATGAAEVK